MTVSTTQLIAWIAGYLWPFARIAAMVSVAPILGTQTVPVRVRVGIAVALTAVIAPLVPPIPGIEPFSLAGVIVTAQQVLIGLAMGFAVRLVFSALENGGNSVAMLMGLGFAEMMDPQSGVQVPMISQFFTILAGLLFLALDGHLVLVQVVAQSFHTLPIGLTGLSGDGLWKLVSWGGWIFAGAVLIALPAIAALLIVNIAFGVMTRAAPQLNIFAVGFPISLILGFIILLLVLPTIVPKFSSLLSGSFDLIDAITGAGA